MPIRGALPSDVVAQIRELYLEGEKAESIALECETSSSTVEKYTNDLPRRSPRQEALRLQAIDMAGLGVDVREIATRLKCSISTVVRALARPPEFATSEEKAAEARRQERAQEMVVAFREKQAPAPTLDACDSSSSSGTIERKPG